MPRLNIDEFNEEPSVGDKVKVVGKVKSIEDGMVEISYDKVTIMDKKRRKNRDNDDDDDDDFVEVSEETTVTDGMNADEALNRYFSENR